MNNNSPIGVEPPAIVQPALFADVLTALLSEAQGFGRKTIKHKVACGRKLLAAKEELERRNEQSSPSDRVSWPKLLKRFGFTESTAWRLMKSARSHDSFKVNSELDRIFDDGYDPALDEGKIPCRECRIRGKKFDKKCGECRGLNKTLPAIKEDKPLVDMDGNLVPEALLTAWAEAALIRSAMTPIKDVIGELAGLAQRSGCAALNPKEIRTHFTYAFNYVWSFRPGLPCQPCEGVPGKQCQQCNGLGYRTVRQVTNERHAEKEVERHRKADEYRAKQKRSNEPIPE